MKYVVIRNWRKTAGARLGLVTRQQVFRAIWLGVIIGVVSGVGAIVFFEMIAFVTEHVLHDLTGYVPPEPIGELGGHVIETSDPTRPWALPIVLGLGGLAAGVIVYLFAPEAEGHGTDAAIAAYHHKGGRTRLRVAPIKIIASSITIGSGGAAGREGPTAQIGGAFGSFIADRLGLGAIERRRALAAGMGAGIGAIFRAPLGGAMMAAEVFYTHDFEADVILLGLISSIVAFTVYGSYYDYTPIFGGTAGFSYSQWSELPYYAGVGLICGLMGILYARGFYGVTGLFKRLQMPVWAKPAIGGVLVGAIGIGMPEAIHVGYGFVQQSLTVEQVTDFPLWLLIALPFTRILTTSLTVGSGGSGGIFGPGMVIGGITGALIWRLGADLPGFPEQPGPVVIIAMIAMFGAIAHAPLAMLLMVGEMTGNLSLLGPAMVAVAVATLLVGDETIYKSQVPTRADSTAHRHRFAFPLLSALPTARAVVPVTTVAASLNLRDALALMGGDSSTGRAVVVDEKGAITGDLSVDQLRAAAEADDLRQVSMLVKGPPPIVLGETPLDEALDMLSNHERRWLPVTDGAGGPILGAVDAGTLVRAYRRAVQSQVRPLSPVDEDVNTLELIVGLDSSVRGLRLSDAHLPPGVRILTISHDGEVRAPDGMTVLRAGDLVTLSLPRGTVAEVMEMILGD